MSSIAATSTDSQIERPFPSLLTTAEVASLFRVDPRTVERWCREGRLRPIRLAPRSIRYRADEIAALIERSTDDHEPAANGLVGKTAVTVGHVAV